MGRVLLLLTTDNHHHPNPPAMPELPDVEIFKRYADATALHKPVDSVHVDDTRLLTDTTPQQLGRQLAGRAFHAARRHGKFLNLHTDDQHADLVLHFGMTGELHASHDPHAQAPQHTALRIHFRNGHHLDFTNKRRLGRIALTDDFDQFIAREGLGPDAAETNLQQFRRICADHASTIKALLMNQQAIAGLGNIYADETLFHARTRPDTPADQLTDRQTAAIHRAMRRVIRTAIRHDADPAAMPRSWLLPRRTPSEPCPRCGRPIEKSTISGRATYWCPGCQS